MARPLYGDIFDIFSEQPFMNVEHEWVWGHSYKSDLCL